MINLTNDLVFLTSGSDLRRGILEAISATRKILIDAYYGGRYIRADDITATSYAIPKTFPMAFCKYFSGEDFFENDVNVSEVEFLNCCNELICGFRKTRNLTLSDFSGILPQFQTEGAKLAQCFMYAIKRGIQIMLFALWRAGHILLTTGYIMPTTKESAHGTAKNLCISLYTEVIEFFQGFRQRVIPGTSVIQPSEGLTKSIQNTIQSYAWRVVVATDWHTFEAVSQSDCVEFLNYISEREEQKQTRIPYPIIHMIQLLNDHASERMSFNTVRIARERSEKQNPLGDPRTTRTYAPKSISCNSICESISGEKIAEKYPEWIGPQTLYIKLCKKQGKKSIKDIEASLSILNEYLFAAIPSHKREAGNSDLSAPSPAEFDRKYFDDDADFPTLLTHACKGRIEATGYSYLRIIDSFFKYFEHIDRNRSDGRSFINPIIREVDFPKTRRSKGSNKEIISQAYLPTLLSYLYALEGLFSYVYEELLNGNRRLIRLFDRYSTKFNSQINTEDLGYCPLVLFRNKYVPITTVMMDAFQASEILVRGNRCRRAPAWSNLIQLIVCLETGIRTKHIEWLDIRKYDQNIDRTKPLGDLVKLFVSTDKTRRTPWSPLVSSRVILLLDKQKKILSELSHPWKGKEIWYDMHEENVFGKIVPAFASPSATSTGLPNRDGYDRFFKRIFYSFQEFANGYEMFSKPVKWVQLTENPRNYRSIITPHSCRATVISNAVHYLPLEIIGSCISSHTTRETVSYYARPDPYYMDQLEECQSRSVKGMESLALINTATAVYADKIDSALHQAICKDKEGAYSDFGATSFDKETRGGEIRSAFSAIKDARSDQLAFQTTHICAMGNNCPEDVVVDIGCNQCGECWYAMKTVEHIPRIDSHVRSLYAEINEDQIHIDEMISAGASKSVIEITEGKVARKASNLAGWTVSLNILEDMRKNLSTRNKFLVGEPDVIKNHIQKISTPSNPLTNLLLRVQDAVSYPEYLTPQLKASMTKVRNLVLARTGAYDQIFRQPNGYAQLDEFRGIIRSVLETSGLSVEDLQTLITSELPMPNNQIPILRVG